MARTCGSEKHQRSSWFCKCSLAVEETSGIVFRTRTGCSFMTGASAGTLSCKGRIIQLDVDLDRLQGTRESRTDSRSWWLQRRHLVRDFSVASSVTAHHAGQLEGGMVHLVQKLLSFVRICFRCSCSAPSCTCSCPDQSFMPSCSMTLHFVFFGGCATNTLRRRSTDPRKNRGRDRCRDSVLLVMLECAWEHPQSRHIPRASVPSSSIDIAEFRITARFFPSKFPVPEREAPRRVARETCRTSLTSMSLRSRNEPGIVPFKTIATGRFVELSSHSVRRYVRALLTFSRLGQLNAKM